jgi:hypothetical protein
MLAIAPRNLFCDDSVFGTSDTTHAVNKPKRNVPQRNEFEPTMLRGSVVSRTSTRAFRTNTLRVLARLEFGDKTLGRNIVPVKSSKGNFRENEGLVIGYKIEYRFKEHLGG